MVKRKITSKERKQFKASLEATSKGGIGSMLTLSKAIEQFANDKRKTKRKK